MEEERKKTTRPKTQNSSAAQQIEKAREQFDAFDASIKDMTLDRMATAPKEECLPQTKLSSREVEKKPEVYLKPSRSVSSREKFNEKFRDDWNYQKEYVQFIAEHKELIGENIEMWTKPFPGIPAEYWEIPTNKPIWGPRHLAEQIKRKSYHRFTMRQNTLSQEDGMGQYYGAMAVDTSIQRLDAVPVSKRKSVFMGANSF